MAVEEIRQPALDAHHLGKPGIVGDIGGFAGPGRDGAGARGHQEQAAILGFLLHLRAVVQQCFEDPLLTGGESLTQLYKMYVLAVQGVNVGVDLLQVFEQFLGAERG